MAKQAILLHDGELTKQLTTLEKTLEFFGIPWRTGSLAEFPESDGNACDQVVFGSASVIGRAYRQAEGNNQIGSYAAFYAFADEDLPAAERGIRSILNDGSVTLREAREGIVKLRVSPQLGELVGSMAGIEARARMRKEDAVVAGLDGQQANVETVISAGGAPVYLKVEGKKGPIYLCASNYMIDLDQEVGAGHYDVKAHFCSVVPLISFVRYVFREVMWQPQEIGACLIIDDPLLKKRYGCCDFEKLRDLMKQHEFTTNIAFIPWNWWRTSPDATGLFGDGLGAFSVSIHGCDHVKAEFGNSSRGVLSHRARLAQARMQMHEDRTGIHHDQVMVFPQGVFSSASPGILKRTGLIAAVNTQISPVDGRDGRTRVRDVWDVAIMKYDSFAIFTRRYADHGVENLAFDILLGKPCLIAAHHQFFKDESIAMMGLLEKLQGLNCAIKWRPLGEVIRRACRWRTKAPLGVEIEMYGTELVFANPKHQEVSTLIKKREASTDSVTHVQSDLGEIEWHPGLNSCSFEATIGANSERHFRVCYRDLDDVRMVEQSVAFKSSVAVRRILSEFADACVGKGSSISFGKAGLLRRVPRSKYRTGSSVSTGL